MSAIWRWWRHCYWRQISLHNHITWKFLSVIFVSILLNNAAVVDGLRCYAGNPHRKRECTSMSYCLMITAKTGHTQWSCDGNSFTQLALCQNLGMDAPRLKIYEAPSTSRQLSAFQGVSSSAGGATPDGNTVYIRSPNEMSHFGTSGTLKDHVDPRLGTFVNDVTANGGVREYYRSAGGAPRSSLTPGGTRCFDVGALGRICCCATDYCNSAYGIYSQSIIGRVLVTIIFVHLFLFKKCMLI